MEFKNIFSNDKELSEQELISVQKQNDEDSSILQSGTHPQAYDEQTMMEQRAQLAEIRRWQQDRDPAYQKLFEKLAGLTVDEEGNLIKDPYITKPLCSINGARQLVTFIETQDVNTIMSNYSETRINIVLRHGIAFPLIEYIQYNYDELGIEKNMGKLNYIVNIILNAVEPVYLRALNNGERQFESSITKNIYHKNLSDGINKKKGLFGWK